MLLTLDNQSGALRVRRYTTTELWVEEQCVREPCILSPQRLITGWPAIDIASLTRAQLQPLLDLKPRILLIGDTGPPSRPPTALRREIESLGVALECMELGAACRTYNVLSQEGREVVAGLIPVR
jgi:uncharacterized protein